MSCDASLLNQVLKGQFVFSQSSSQSKTYTQWPIECFKLNNMSFGIKASTSTRANPLAMAPMELSTRPSVTSCPVLLKSSTQQS